MRSLFALSSAVTYGIFVLRHFGYCIFNPQQKGLIVDLQSAERRVCAPIHGHELPILRTPDYLVDWHRPKMYQTSYHLHNSGIMVLRPNGDLLSPIP